MKLRNRLQSAVRRLRPPKPKPLILMYHRIADDPLDNWDLAVSPAHFEEHLHILRRTRCPFPLTDFVCNLIAGTLPSNAVALTFDDGYVDNLVAGKPRLAAADVPATVFLATGYLDRPGEFWWDELARMVLGANVIRSFELVVGGTPMYFDVDATPARNDRTMGITRATGRQELLTAIWRAVRPLEDEERESIMVELRSMFSVGGDHIDRGRAMTREEVRALASDGLITIGAHTVTHPLLSELEVAACHREVVESKLTCETLIGAPVAGFAYPYGDIDSKTREAVRASGFKFACSTRHEPIGATSDVFALPRLHVHSWDGDAFEQALVRLQRDV